MGWKPRKKIKDPKIPSLTISPICSHTVFLFFFFWLCWVFFAVHRLLGLWQAGATLLRCTGFPCCGAWALSMQASVVAALWHGPRSLGTQSQLPRGVCYLPRPEIECLSPVSAGGVLTSGPPGKSLTLYFIINDLIWLNQLNNKFQIATHWSRRCIIFKTTRVKYCHLSILQMRKIHTIVFCKRHWGAVTVKSVLEGFIL